MEVEVQIIQGIPEAQLDYFKDKVVYYTAIATRENTKGRNAYPYLSGDLRRAEVASPVLGTNKEYCLLQGVKYAKYVYNFRKANWTNPSTLPQWYHNVFKSRGSSLVMEATHRALKELR